MAESRFESATYCNEFVSTYRHEGTASFQLSPVNTALNIPLKSEAADEEGDIVRDASTRAAVRLTVSFNTSFMKTAVDVIYRWPPTRGMTRE